jgi:hypothetical protein
MPGSLDHEEQDVKTFITWVKYLYIASLMTAKSTVTKVADHLILSFWCSSNSSSLNSRVLII